MGQAKLRGTYEERRAKAIARNRAEAREMNSPLTPKQEFFIDINLEMMRRDLFPKSKEPTNDRKSRRNLKKPT